MISIENDVQNLRCKKYFSLVELLVVIAIIGILVAIAGGGFALVQRKMAETKTQATLHKLKLALEAYKQKHGYYIQERNDQYFLLDRDKKSGKDANFNRHVNVSELGKSGALLEFAGPTSNYEAWYWVIDGYKPQKSNDKDARRIRYLCPGTDGAPFELRSCGKDETFNTDDDIVVN